MVNYQNGKIYTVRCRTDDTLIYVGSTAEERLSARWGRHKTQKKVSLFEYVKEYFNGDWSDWYIELYQLYPCNSKMELEKREGEIQREIATINKCIAGRTHKEYLEWYNPLNKDKIKKYKNEYYENNKDKILEKTKKYYENNKEKINEKTKEYYENNKDKINEKSKEYNEKNKEHILEKTKEYYENNKDKINGKKKEYYEKNKGKINENKKEYREKNKEKYQEKVICECGCKVATGGLTEHKKTKKHINLMANVATIATEP